MSDDRLDAARKRLEQSNRALAQAQVDTAVPWDFKTAKVTATSPLTVDYGDGTGVPNIGRLAQYTPTINDVVLVLVRAPVATILGKFA